MQKIRILISYILGNNAYGDSLSKIADLSIPHAGNMSVIIRNKSNGKQNIKISVDSTKYYTADDISIGYDFGFFTNHYSHNCHQIGQFELKDIKIKCGIKNN